MFIQWIIQHLPHLILLAATAPIVPDSGSVGAIIDAGLGEGSTDPGSDGSITPVDPTEGGGDGLDGSSSSEAEIDPTDKVSTEGKIDWRTVPADVKKHISEITKSNPKLGNLLQNAVYTSQSFLKEIPGGIKEIRALKTSIEELGGIDEVKNISSIHKQLVEEQETLDTQARQGNPEVLNNLIEIAGNEGFSKLMPIAISKWAAANPQEYSHQMSKLMVNSMREGGLVADLNLAFKMLNLNSPEATKEAVECLKRAAEWANGIHKISTTKPTAPTVDPQVQQQQKNIDDQKAQLFNSQFASEFGSWRNKEIGREVASISGGRQLNEYQMKTLGERVVSDIRDILTADPDYMKSLQRLYDARNMAELHKFARARTAKHLPEVTKKAYRSLFSNPTKKPVPAKSASAAQNPQPQQTVKGWTKVLPDKAPAPGLIDDKKTSFEMKFRKQAILKDGSKVYWGNSVPA